MEEGDDFSWGETEFVLHAGLQGGNSQCGDAHLCRSVSLGRVRKGKDASGVHDTQARVNFLPLALRRAADPFHRRWVTQAILAAARL